MIKKLSAAFLTFLILIIAPKFALAHVLKTDGSIGAVMHTDPDDNPVAKDATGIFFDFQDKQNKFKIENCNCIISIIEDGKEIFSQNLTQPAISYTFPDKNLYQIKVVGKPNSENDFQTFSLVYDISVAKESANPSNLDNPPTTSWFSTHIVHLIGGIIVFVFLIFALIKQKSQQKFNQ